jgi:hypothetical protein
MEGSETKAQDPLEAFEILRPSLCPSRDQQAKLPEYQRFQQRHWEFQTGLAKLVDSPKAASRSLVE